MFSGIVAAVGEVRRIGSSGEGTRVRVRAGSVLEGARPGDSIAVSGVCLTIVAVAGPEFEADLSPETIRRTTLGQLVPGDLVNLEPALRADQRLGGHLVQGHVDAVGTITAFDRQGPEAWMEIQPPDEVRPYLVEKGSVAVDGVSLTVARLTADGAMAAALIPHTLAATTLRHRRPGDRVNIEVDMLAKYVSKYMQALIQEGKVT